MDWKAQNLGSLVHASKKSLCQCEKKAKLKFEKSIVNSKCFVCPCSLTWPTDFCTLALEPNLLFARLSYILFTLTKDVLFCSLRDDLPRKSSKPGLHFRSWRPMHHICKSARACYFSGAGYGCQSCRIRFSDDRWRIWPILWEWLFIVPIVSATFGRYLFARMEWDVAQWGGGRPSQII